MHFLPAFLRKDSKASLINDLLKKIAQEDELSDKDIFNVVVIGQTGVGVSSLINMTAGFSQAPVSTDVSPCTKSFTAYPFTLNNRSFRLIDSPGFGSSKCPTSTITKALRELDAQFGIDLVVNCLRGTRGDANAGYQNYTAIRSAVSDDVPIVAVVTCLERYGETMDHWWSTNEADLKARRMVFADHACVTTLDASTVRDGLFKNRVSESERAAKQLIMRNCWAEKRGVARGMRQEDTFYLGASQIRGDEPKDQIQSAILEPRRGPGRVSDIITSPSFIIKLEIDSAALKAWEHGQLPDAEALLTAAIPTSNSTSHHVLASRSLVRARLHQWDDALVDAEESIQIWPSVIGYTGKCVALVGKGKLQKGCRVCDIALQQLHIDHLAIHLLIKAVALFMAGEHDDAMSRIDYLISIVSIDLGLYAVQAYMHLMLGNLHMEIGDYELAIRSFRDARVRLDIRTDPPPSIVSLISGWKFDGLIITIQRQSCMALLSAGRVNEASISILSLVDQNINTSRSMKMWASEFMQKCLSMLDDNGSVTEAVICDINAPVLPSVSHVLHPMKLLFRHWARLRLTTGSWNDVLLAAECFTLPRFTIYQIICEDLEMTGHVVDAIACAHQMCSELAQRTDKERDYWAQDFKSRCHKTLENNGDAAMNAEQYDEAISQYTAALSLNPAVPQDVLVKRSRAYLGMGLWEDALSDANEIVLLDPSSPLGYERKHAALHGAGRYDDAIDAFDTMLLKISESSDPEIREQSHHYIRRQQTKDAIRTTVQDAIRHSPLVLINTTSGRLCNKSEQAVAFESVPAFAKLTSAMTTHIDHTSIREEVEEFYRYATFSHKWEENEPLYENVIKIVVYDLKASPTHEKLQMFCKIVREAGINWAWSDTCCINKADHFVLQEALVSMFRWYEGSAMTIIFLLGVDRLAGRGALTRCIWNMRAWTLQEYHASKVVRIYTQDWTPYLGLTIYNHKDSPEVISEMEEATGISAQALMALRPGPDYIREKLRLASTRQTTRVEDAAYLLLGIFSSSLPIVYGEGDKSLGRLLAQLLASSGDMTIIAWTGRPGSFNTCLPSSITVFRQPPTSYIPPSIAQDEMRVITAKLRSLDLTLVSSLYDRVNELPVPSFSGYRMKLPCLTFKLGPVSVTQQGSERVFRAQANALGVVEIRTEEDLSELGSLCLIHPWIDILLDRRPVGRATDRMTEDDVDDQSFVLPSLPDEPKVTSPTQKTLSSSLFRRLGRPFGGRPISTVPDIISFPPSTSLAGGRSTISVSDTVSLLPPSTVSPVKKQMHALRFIARLRQPFGALLLTRTRQNMDEYRRVAAESLITVRVKEFTPAILEKLINGVRMLDVL